MSQPEEGTMHSDSAVADIWTEGRVRPEMSRPEAADPRRWRALAVTQFTASMVLLDVSIVNVALPSIEWSLAVSATTAQRAVPGEALLAAAGFMLLALLMVLAELIR